MKKGTVLMTVLLFFLIGNAQTKPETYNVRVEYSLVYSPDSNNMGDKRQESMILLCNEEGSSFFKKSTYVMDSVLYANYQKGYKYGVAPGMKIYTSGSFLKFQQITKSIDGQIQTVEPFERGFLTYTEHKKGFDWQIKNTIDTLFGIACQKAECNFGGRRWTAWFAPSIPIFDGPYKFCGLPGLIITIGDITKSYHFQMTSILHKKTTLGYIPKVKKVLQKTTKEKALQARRNEQKRMLAESLGNALKTSSYKKDNNWIELY